MKLSIVSLLILSASKLFAQQNDITITESFHPETLGESRLFSVRVPSGLSPGQQVPVVYVLDGEANFESVVRVLHDLSEEHEAASAMVVVGVGNIWSRYRDYTPTQIASSPYVDQQSAATTGGGPKFVSFLKKELIPYVDTKYPVSSTRVLVGHSLGGLIAIDMLVNHREMFTHYIAVDPSMWWDERKLLTEAQSVFKTGDFKNRSLYLAIANVSEKNMDMRQIRNDRSEKTELVRPNVMLADHLSGNKQNGLTSEYRFYKDNDHMSAFRPAMYDGMQIILKLL